MEGWESCLSLALPGLTTSVALKGLSACRGGSWHTVACVLHLRPCHGSSLRGGVCQEVCVRLMTQCAKLPLPPHPKLSVPSSARLRGSPA